MLDKDKLTEIFESIVDANWGSNTYWDEEVRECIFKCLKGAYDIAKQEDAWINVDIPPIIMENKSKKDILKNHGEAYEYSYRLKVTPYDDAITAMQAYADQETAAMQSENAILKSTVERLRSLLKQANEYVHETKFILKENIHKALNNQ